MMQFNFHFLRFLTEELHSYLVDKKLTESFSQNRNELVMKFESEDEFFFIKINLDGEQSLISFPQEFARARRNSVDLFTEIIGKHVSGIRQYENERSFSLSLGDWDLLFKLHGRRANLILFNEGAFHSMFKSEFVQDKELIIEQLDRPIDQSDAAIVNNGFDLKVLFPTYDKAIKNYLQERGFDSIADQAKLDLLHQLNKELNTRTIYLNKPENGFPTLSILPIANSELYDNAVLASNAYAYAFLINYQFNKEKQKELRILEKEITKAKNYIANTEAKIDQIITSRGYDEVANILMANLHQPISKEQSSIELFDFYNEANITIKLKPKLNLQQNAEVLYRKAKNQGIELSTAEKNLALKEANLKQLEEKYLELTEVEDLKTLRQYLKQDQQSNKQKKETIPFYHCNISGYTVWIGKNAKNNDLLTQKYARKNDLWMHAKDVAGSHAIIRNENDKPIPKDVIEKAAEITAWYSKRKSDTICPVIYTPKKYVRKPKGSLPGQVIVDREDVILVKPDRSLLNAEG